PQNDLSDEPAVPARLDAQLPPAETEVVLIPVTPEAESPPTTVELPPSSSIQNSEPEHPEGHAEQLPDVQDTAPASIMILMTKLWLIGALAVGLWHAWRIGRFRRRLMKALPPPDWLTSEVAQLAARLRIRTPEIAVLPGNASPLVWTLGEARSEEHTSELQSR